LVDPKNFDTLSAELENRLDDLFGENDIRLPDVPEKDLKEHYPLAELKNLILSIDWEITDDVLDKLLLQINDLQLTYEHDKIVATFLQILNSLGNYIRTHRAKAHPKTFKILNSVFASLDKVVLAKGMTDRAKKKILRAEMNRYKDLRTQIAENKAAAAKPKAKPVAVQQPEIKALKEEPAVQPAGPSEAPDLQVKQEPPVALPDEPSVVPELKIQEKEPVISLAKPSKPPAVAVNMPPPATQPDSETDPAMAALADAVEEIKQYIHTEITALKEEIQSLRAQQ